MGLPEPAEVARRVRAALAYADIDIKHAEPQVGISSATIARIVSPSTPRGVRGEAELDLIAQATGVPIGFLINGWPLEEPTLIERVEALEHQLGSVRGELSEVSERLLERLEREVAQPPSGPRRDVRDSETGRDAGGPG